MENVPGFNSVRYDPSRLRPQTVVADVNVEISIGESFPRTEAKIEVLWRPREGTDVQRVHWADDVVSLGWHKDDDHSELGTTHFQLEAGDGSVHEPGEIEVEAPLSFLEICLDRLPERLQETIRTQ
ncbi:hypothetical protein [Halorussus amylolyticus]|uniref:hypothetical protein n=1 Tax=Halorussus amylolyticus TaxID=1126242 RepID=UPI00192FA861|nr:hypothetical protein [Halorussus amylolyticus]